MSLSISHQCSTTTHSFLSLEIYSKSHVNVCTLCIFSEDVCNDANINEKCFEMAFCIEKGVKVRSFFEKLSEIKSPFEIFAIR